MSEERKRILGMVAAGKLTIDEAEQLLDALGKNGSAVKEPIPGAVQSNGSFNPKYLRVMVDSMQGDNVNVRVPVSLLRTGLKLSTLIPRPAYDKINQNLSEHGFDIDLSSFKQEDIEKLVESMSELNVDVNSAKGDKEKVYFE
jgi:hypothetical protein